MRTKIALVAVAIGLTGCSGMELGRTEKVQPQGAAFSTELYQGYLGLSRDEYREADYRDSDTFARRARLAATGGDPLPEELAARRLPRDSAPDLAAARTRLVGALDRGGRERFPADAARAQVAFDCWMQEQEENHQPNDIARCRDTLTTTLASLETALAPAPVAAAPAPPAEPRVFTVLFDFDKAELGPAAQQTLAQAIDYAKATGAPTISIAGHADRAGSDSYNERLAMFRAEIVAASLNQAGLPSTGLKVEAFGERDPAVVTRDGVREGRNRRVTIVVAP